MNSLKKKAVKGVHWSVVDNIASSGVSFIIGLVLARLLSPEEFGILGMIAIFIAISNAIIDSGFSNALIRKIDSKPIDYNTVFYFNLVVGIILYLTLYILAPAISHFFEEPILIPVTRIMGVTLIINSFGAIQRTLLIKRLDFKTQTKISIIASTTSGIVGIGFAFYGLGVWSLVGQQISRQLINSLFLWIYSKWKPTFEFSINSFYELFGFGSKLLLSSLISAVYNNIYYIIIGRFFTAGQLGQYTRSEQFNNIFTTNLSSVVQRVSFPVLSNIQNETERLKLGYKKIVKITMLVTFICMFGLAAISGPMILTLIGKKWLLASQYLQIMCFSGTFYPLLAINSSIFQVKGRSDIYLKLEIAKKTIGSIPIVFGILYGIKYMLVGGIVTSIISYLFNSYYLSKLIKYTIKEQLYDLLPTFSISIIIALSIWSFTFIGLPHTITFILQCVIGIILFIILYEKFKIKEYVDLKEIVYSFIKQNNNKRIND